LRKGKGGSKKNSNQYRIKRKNSGNSREGHHGSYYLNCFLTKTEGKRQMGRLKKTPVWGPDHIRRDTKILGPEKAMVSAG